MKIGCANIILLLVKSPNMKKYFSFLLTINVPQYVLTDVVA